MDNKIVVFLTKDLFFIPMLRIASQRIGCEFLFAPSVGNARLAAVAAGQVCLCIVDLTVTSADQLANIAEQLRNRFPGAKLAAFGPHVHEKSLVGAVGADFDFVVTRGQLNKNPEQCLRLWTANEGTQEIDSANPADSL